MAIRDAFRSYNPVGQQPRMVSLFQGLYAAAGVGPERTTAPRARVTVSPVKRGNVTIRSRHAPPLSPPPPPQPATSFRSEAASSLKSAGDIAKALLDLKVTADVQAKVIELNRMILSAQSDAMSAQASQLELLERKSELESELKRLEDWEAEKQRYEMVSAPPGVTIHALKQSAMKPGEPAHVLCPTCYQRSKKSIFQPTPESIRRYRVHRCPECKTELAFGEMPPPPPSPPADNSGGWMAR